MRHKRRNIGRHNLPDDVVVDVVVLFVDVDVVVDIGFSVVVVVEPPLVVVVG